MFKISDVAEHKSARRTTIGADAVNAAIPRGWFVDAGGLAAAQGPIMTADVELGAPISDLAVDRQPHGEPFTAVQVLARLHGHPIGMVLLQTSYADPSTETICAPVLVDRIWAELKEAITSHLVEDGLSAPMSLTTAGMVASHSAACSWQARLGHSRPSATVCIATCGRSMPVLLRTVRSALDQTYDNTQVLVIDNRPGTTRLPGPLIEAFPHEDRLYYVTEAQPGLASVRNRGVQEAGTDIVALTDEDVILDPDWLGYLVAAFDQPDVACVTGLILPSQLETRAQILIEEFGGFSKGFRRRRWDLNEHRLAHPLYPYIFGMYGSGANAAWRRPLLEQLGGYDVRLGTGTRTRGGEDLDAYLSCIRGGYQLIYEPAALVRHEHRRTLDHVRRQVFDYGVGLGAVMAKRLLHHDERREMVSRLPAGLDYLLNPRSPKNAGKSAGFPKALTVAELAGIAYGPIAYLRGGRRP